jgi:hypothetical protein
VRYSEQIYSEELKKIVRMPQKGTLKYLQTCKALIKFFKSESQTSHQGENKKVTDDFPVLGA